jgi:uncharacterized iron-regulated membrane protein
MGVANARYCEIMTILIILVAIAAAIATLAGFVAWRDRRGRRSFVDPSVRRDAVAQAHREAIERCILGDLPPSLPTPFNF